eukprot:g16335.t1
MSCLSGLASAFCGAQIEEAAKEKAQLELLKRELEELKDGQRDAESPVNKKYIDMKLQQQKDQLSETAAKNQELLKKEVELKSAQIEQMQLEKDILEKTMEEDKEKLAAVEKAVETQGSKVGKMEGIFSNVSGIMNKKFQDFKEEMDAQDGNHEPDGQARAFQLDWDSMRLLDHIVRDKDEPRWLSDKYRSIQNKLSKPPTIAGKPFREFAKDVHFWVQQLYPLNNTFEELGRELLAGAFEGAHHEKQRASAAGPDVLDMMKTLTVHIAPLVETVEHAAERYLPKVVRREGHTPTAHFHLMQDVFDLEAKVCEKKREDKAMWERTASSLLLDKHSEIALRATYKNKASNNFENIGVVLDQLNIEDVERYECMTLKPIRHKVDDYLEKLFSVLGEGATGHEHRRKVQSVNNFYKGLGVAGQGHSFFGGGGYKGDGGPLAGQPQPDTPRNPGTPRGGNPNNGNSGTSGAPGGTGKRYTKEELKEIQNKPRQFGKKCNNLLKNGACLFKHTPEELKICFECFEKDFPEKAAEKKKKREERKKEQKAAADKKKAEAAKNTSAPSS